MIGVNKGNCGLCFSIVSPPKANAKGQGQHWPVNGQCRASLLLPPLSSLSWDSTFKSPLTCYYFYSTQQLHLIYTSCLKPGTIMQSSSTKWPLSSSGICAFNQYKVTALSTLIKACKWEKTCAAVMEHYGCPQPHSEWVSELAPLRGPSNPTGRTSEPLA